MPILKRHQVQFDPERGSRSSHAGAHRTASRQRGSSARLVRVEGVVRAIEFTCACGETTLIEVEFDPREPSPDAPASDD